MPELPEVETVRRGLQDLTLGKVFTGGEVLLDRIFISPQTAPLDRLIADRQFTTWDRRGKYLLGHLDNGAILGVHLRMTGQLLWLHRGEPLTPHTRLRLFAQNQGELRFIDCRTFGRIWWVPPDRPVAQVITGLALLGPEPWDGAFTLAYVRERLKRSTRAIKTFLLDQQFVAGLGNIYADEVLFHGGIRPDRPAASLSPQEGERIHRAIPQVLEAAIAKGGTTFSDFLNLLGVQGNYGDAAWVYQRTGLPCKVCGTAIHRRKLGGRSSHFCPQCQH